MLRGRPADLTADRIQAAYFGATETVEEAAR
jgi:hypothetical protein